MSSNDGQQITPFDGYGSDVVEYAPGAGGMGGGGGGGMNGGQRLGGNGGNGADAPAPGGLMRRIHNSLRGRYWIGLVFGAVLGGTGGYFGYKSQQPIYRGEAMIQVAFNRPIVLQQTPDSGPMINYEEFVQSEAMMISSRRIIDLAMNGPEWKATGFDADSPAAQAQVQALLAANLSVEHPSRTEIIRVYFTDKDPGVAGATVKAVVKAYENYSKNKAQVADDNRLRVLSERRSLILGQIAGAENQIYSLADKYGTHDLAAYVEAKIAEEGKIEARKNEAELALQAARRKKDAKSAIFEMTENQIAMMDPVMRGLLMERDGISAEIAKRTAAGAMKEAMAMKQLASALEFQQKKVDRYAAEWRDLQLRLSDDPSLASGGIGRIIGMSEKVLAAEVASLTDKFNQLKQERTEIGRHMLKIEQLKQAREELIKERSEVQRRMDLLQIEASNANRVTVINSGDVPMKPFKDRRKMFGAAGAMAGFGLPMGILVMLGLLDKRYRFSDEANDGVHNVPLLGILPRLPDKLSDPEQAAVAAHCIHQIRIMLQVGQNPDKRRAFMVTSASTGDGKTSLTMALGLSFAASGSKTLVIDCDMVGQGLTHRLKAHNVPGLIETLNLGTLRGHVRKTASKGLYVLPIGLADAVHAGVLSPQSIKRLLAACREHFDVVVIDTGPILGSLEASVVAAEVDGVIIAVARGQQQPLVEKAVRHLRSVGANIFGIVFNRAEQRDFQRSVASASIRSQSAKPNEPRHLLPDTEESSRFGPLARSVASCLPASSAASHSGTNGNGNAHQGHGNGDS
jgi:capsular exopolysaccharide synthesis family protein